MKEDDRLDKRRKNISSASGEKRTFYGVRQIGVCVHRITQPAFKKKSPLLIRLALDWEDFVGPSLAYQTEPRRLSARTLTLACAGPVALELQHQSAQLLARINTICGLQGANALSRLNIVQDYTLKPLHQRSRVVRKPVEVTGIEDEALRSALARLGRCI